MRKNLSEQIKKLKEDLGDLRLTTVYLQFDVEVTRRERDQYKKKLEGKK